MTHSTIKRWFVWLATAAGLPLLLFLDVVPSLTSWSIPITIGWVAALVAGVPPVGLLRRKRDLERFGSRDVARVARRIKWTWPTIAEAGGITRRTSRSHPNQTNGEQVLVPRLISVSPHPLGIRITVQSLWRHSQTPQDIAKRDMNLAAAIGAELSVDSITPREVSFTVRLRDPLAASRRHPRADSEPGDETTLDDWLSDE